MNAQPVELRAAELAAAESGLLEVLVGAPEPPDSAIRALWRVRRSMGYRETLASVRLHVADCSAVWKDAQGGTADAVS